MPHVPRLFEEEDGVYLDCTGIDYAFTPHDGGKTGGIVSWTLPKPKVDTYLLLRNGDEVARYKVTSVDLCMNVDPATMWMAKVRHAPSYDP